MALTVREMALEETELIIDYFHTSSVEHLESMGVDPSRLFPRPVWRERYAQDYPKPRCERAFMAVVWLEDQAPVGFSTADKIVFGERANMHLHVLDPARRASGVGAACVRQTVELYFETLKLKSLFCEPNAFNTAPNRTVQAAGFRYVKTHMTVPGPLNFHQPVTRWLIER
ncbi:MAG TPA: GNAT family protein [Caulobacteraceae bacterium]|nr:GNAT family protein [Caulobacteraceae bacterium]